MIPIRDDTPRSRWPVVTWSLIAINLLVFLYETQLPPHQLEQLFYLRGLVPARYTHPAWAAHVGFPPDDYLGAVTSMFLHGGWWHVIANMWVLWIFGDNVEDQMGPVRFLGFYLLCGLAAAGMQVAVNPGSTVPTVGASGAIAGVLGAYFYLFPRARVLTLFPILFIPLFFWVPAVLFLLVWFVLQLWSGTIAGLGPGDVGGVAWWAHVGGFATGLLLHRLFLAPPRLPEHREHRRPTDLPPR